MNDRELQKVLNAIKYIPEDGRDEVTQIILKAASESITLERLKTLTSREVKSNGKEHGTSGFVKFTKKEIESMSDNFKKLFVVNDKIVTYRYINGVYQARFRRDGYNIEVASKNFDMMKQKFLERLIKDEKAKKNARYPLLKDFLAEWLQVKKQTVKTTTYTGYCTLIDYHVLPRFGDMHINEITRSHIQNFLFELTDAGKNRTAAKLKQLLSAIFNVACEDYNLKSPMTKIALSHYEVKKGRAFTKDEERKIVDFCKCNPHYEGNSAMLLLMYTGMRVGELKSMKYDGTFVTCESEKTRKGYATVIRKIPVSPMLKRVLDMIDFDLAQEASKYAVRDAIKRIFPDRHIHELRYTFITRAKECGCDPELIMKWVGHEFDQDVKTSRVDRGYTTFSEEYSLKEINKIDYIL